MNNTPKEQVLKIELKAHSVNYGTYIAILIPCKYDITGWVSVSKGTNYKNAWRNALNNLAK